MKVQKVDVLLRDVYTYYEKFYRVLTLHENFKYFKAFY